MAETTQTPARAEGTALRPRATELASEQGTTSIADAVVAKIVGIAAREVEGVRALVPFGSGQAIAGLTQRFTGGDDTRSQLARVEVGAREAAVDLKMIVNYGVSIPQVAEGVRRNVINRVQSMTGLMVKEVNIDVTDLYFPEDEGKATQAERRVE
jgi:uncharacterized alkaline shock family protein YloU